MGAPLSYDVVDVFTDTAFAGNPLAVVLDADELSTEQCQALAREFHLSETSFLMRPRADGADYRVRIFTPEAELPFAGHPSVGAAWVLARLGRVAPGRVVQECGAGLLPLQVEPGPGRVRLTGGTPRLGEPLDPAPLLAAVGLEPADLLPDLPVRSAGTGVDFAYLPVREEAVARAAPDVARLHAAAPGLLGVSVFAPDRLDVHARVFAAEVGVTEDPATGSAALGLGVWLAAAGLVPADGATAYTVRQGAEIARPSLIEGEVTTAGGVATSVSVTGSVVPVARGEIARPA